VRVFRFVELTPSTIVALAVRADGSLIAVGRENGDIELWDCKNGYICQSVRAAVAALFCAPITRASRLALISS
jgi:hypothetical protein